MEIMNKATLIGRLAADPELKKTGSGIAVTSFTIAVDRPYSKDAERPTDWIDIVAWRSTAEFICKYFQKGSPIVVEGSIQTRLWEDKAGQKRKSVEVVADSVEFAPRSSCSSQEAVSKAENETCYPAEISPEGFAAVDDEDYPF